jgi:hypothetical protein
MKTIAIALLALISFLSVNAQNNGSNNDDGAVSSDISLTGEGSRDRVIAQFTFDNWFHQAKLTNGQDFDTKWYSRGANIYIMYDFEFGENSIFSFAPGIGYGHSSIFSNGVIGQDSASGEAVFEPKSEQRGEGGRIIRDFKKNKLALNYLEVPIELRMRTKPDKKGNSFKVAIGFKGGWLFDAHSKKKYDVDKITSDGTITKKVKVQNFENLFNFRYGPTFRIGYSSINVIAYYGLSGVFEDGKGPDITPFSLGISFNGL